METLYLGGYTRGENEGIHALSLDMEGGRLTESELIIRETNPTYFALSQDGQHLYTLTENGEDMQPGVAHYLKAGDSFQLVSRVSVLASNGCYLSLDENKQVIYLANYGEGQLSVVRINTDGSMTVTDTLTHEGQGPHENQDKAHAHFIRTTPDGDYVLSCDLGTDEVHTYQLTADDKLAQVSVLTVEPGTGPRHLVHHPQLSIVYLLGELSYTVDVLNFDNQGQLTPVNRYASMPADYQAFNSSAAIRISADGRFLYVSNRGHNSLTVFSISDDGQSLTKIQTIPTAGDFPRDFNFNHSEDYIIVGHQNESKITLFKRDQTTGLLTEVQRDFAVPEIVCVVHQ